MKKNLMIAMLLLNVVLVSFVISASVTGYLVRGGAFATDGYTATLQRVDAGVATVEVITPSGATEVIQVVEGETAQVGEVTISASNFERKGSIFSRRGADIKIITPTPTSIKPVIPVTLPVNPCNCTNWTGDLFTGNWTTNGTNWTNWNWAFTGNWTANWTKNWTGTLECRII